MLQKDGNLELAHLIPPFRFKVREFFHKVFVDTCLDQLRILLGKGRDGADVPDVPAIAPGIHKIREFLMQLWKTGSEFPFPAF